MSWSSASEATPEKWRVRRKQMRARNGAAETWRDSAAASSIAPASLKISQPSDAAAPSTLSTSAKALLGSFKPVPDTLEAQQIDISLKSTAADV